MDAAITSAREILEAAAIESRRRFENPPSPTGEKDMDEMKPGYKTTEFWLTVGVTVIGLASASGLIASGSGVEKVLGLISSALATMGYSYSRGVAKAK